MQPQEQQHTLPLPAAEVAASAAPFGLTDRPVFASYACLTSHGALRIASTETKPTPFAATLLCLCELTQRHEGGVLWGKSV